MWRECREQTGDDLWEGPLRSIELLGEGRRGTGACRGLRKDRSEVRIVFECL